MGYPDWCEIKGALAARSLNGQVVIFFRFLRGQRAFLLAYSG